MRLLSRTLFCCLIWTLAGAVGHAVVVVGWDFSTQINGTGNWGPSPFPTATVASNVTASGLTRGSGVGTPSGGSAAGNAWGGTDWLSTSLSNSITNGDYISFTLAPGTGTTLSLSSIDAYNVRRSSTGANTGQWQYSLDGTNFTNIGTSITWGSTTSSAGNAQSAIVLSGIPDLQNINSGSVTLRLANWGGTSTNGTWYLNDPPTASNDIDLSIQGTVAAIPEAGALLFVGVAAGVFSVTRAVRKRWA